MSGLMNIKWRNAKKKNKKQTNMLTFKDLGVVQFEAVSSPGFRHAFTYDKVECFTDLALQTECRYKWDKNFARLKSFC